MSSAPIKVGIVGLSATSWASWSHYPALQSLSSKYQVVAICNSSPSSASAAAAHFKIPESKAYHDIKDMAKDPEVDLIFVSVKVPHHREMVMGAVAQGKNVVCEWPLGKTLSEAEEMVDAARGKDVKTGVVLQGRTIGVFRKAREIIKKGQIGEVFSTGILAGDHIATGKVPEVHAYFSDEANGASPLTIGAGHTLDTLCYILDAEFSSLSAITHITNPITTVISSDGTERTMSRTSPDQILVHGFLNNKIPVSYHVWPEAHSEKSSFVWRISGTKGYIEFRGESALFLTNLEPKLFLSVNGEDEGKEREIKSEKAEGTNNVSVVWEEFADGKEGGYATFDDALIRHRMLQAIQKASKTGERVTYETKL